MFAASRWDTMVEDDAVGVAWINMHIIYRFVSAFVTLRGRNNGLPPCVLQVS